MNNTLFFITSNNNKACTLRSLLKRCPVEVKTKNLNVIEPQLDTSIEIATYKAQQAFEIVRKPIIVEDSSFYINTLNGFPGPYLNYVLRKIHLKGILSLVHDKNDRSCYFISSVVIIKASGEQVMFSGDRENGQIAKTISKVYNDFGWSSLSKIFIPQGFRKSLSELTVSEIEEINKQDKGKSALSQAAIWIENNYVTLFNK